MANTSRVSHILSRSITTGDFYHGLKYIKNPTPLSETTQPAIIKIAIEPVPKSNSGCRTIARQEVKPVSITSGHVAMRKTIQSDNIVTILPAVRNADMSRIIGNHSGAPKRTLCFSAQLSTKSSRICRAADTTGGKPGGGGGTGGQSPPATPPGGQNPPGNPPGGQTPPAKPPGGTTPPATPPGGQTPPATPPGGQTPPGAPPGGTTPPAKPPGGQTPPVTPPGGQAPPATPPGGQPPSAPGSTPPPTGSGPSNTGGGASKEGMIKPPVHVPGLPGVFATALYSAAYKQNKLDNVEQDLIKIRDTFNSDIKLQDFLLSPQVPIALKLEGIQAFKKFNINDITMNLLITLIERRRMTKLLNVIAAYFEIMAAHKGIVECQIISARPLKPEQMERLQQTLAKFLPGKTARTTETIDPALIGGFILLVGQQHINMSMQKIFVKYESLIRVPA